MQECKRIFIPEWISPLGQCSSSNQVANDTTVLQGILQRDSPHRQNPVPAPQTHTCGTSPKPRYPHDAMCDMSQSLEATQSFIFELSEHSKGTEPPGKRTRLTFPSARVDLCQQEHYWFECQVSKFPAGCIYRNWWVWAATESSGTLASFQPASISTGREASNQGLPRPLHSWGRQLPAVQTTVTASRADVWQQNKSQASGHVIKEN